MYFALRHGAQGEGVSCGRLNFDSGPALFYFYGFLCEVGYWHV